MYNRDRLMVKKMRLPWYAFKRKKDLEKRIGAYVRDITNEMNIQIEKQRIKELAQ